MKVEMTPPIKPRRGGEVEVGNVYTNAHCSNYFRIVVAIVNDANKRRNWNNVVCLHVNALGDIVGSSNQPMTYMREHQDLVGKVKQMPSLQVHWLRALTMKEEKPNGEV